MSRVFEGLTKFFEVKNGYAFTSKEQTSLQEEGFLEILKQGHIELGGGLRKDPKRFYVEYNSRLEKYMLRKNDIVMAMTDMKNKVAILGVPAIVDKDKTYLLNQRVGWLKPKEGVISKFFYYQMLDRVFLETLRSKANSGVQVNLSTSAIKEMEFWSPPLQEQKAIAEVLSSLDDKIELLQKQNETLEALAQTLFRQWFIEEADDNWEEVTYDNLFTIVDCLHSKKPEQIEKGKPLLQVYNIAEMGLLDLSKQYLVSNSDYDIWTKRVELTEGDALISKTGRVGAIGFIPSGHSFGIGRNLVGLKIIKNKFFCRALLLSNHTQREINKNTSDGTILSSLHVKSISKLKIKYDSKLAEKVDVQLNPLYQKIENNWALINTLTSTKDTLLPKLMSGQVRVKLD